MTPFGSAKWIWTDKVAKPDEYAEFFDEVYLEGTGAELFISADSNYTVYMNGALQGNARKMFATLFRAVLDLQDATAVCATLSETPPNGNS